MKKINDYIFRKKKRIIIFVAAIILPLLVVVFFGIDTFFKRQKITKDILGSNLLLAGNSALNDLESQLTEIENNLFGDSIFNLPENGVETEVLNNDTLLNLQHIIDYFLIDARYNLIIPDYNSDPPYLSDIYDENNEFKRNITNAELSEFSEGNYSKALNIYSIALKQARTGQDSAITIERMARCYTKLENFPKAIEYYRILLNRFTEIKNKSGHPYGIISTIRLFEINHEESKNQRTESLFEAYKKQRDGFWQLNLSSYLFFKSEIEILLESALIDAISEEFIALKNQQTKFEKKLFLVEFLNDNIVSGLRVKALLPGNYPENNPQRYFFNTGGNDIVISMAELRNFKDNSSYYGGIIWDIYEIKKHLLPVILKKLSKDTGYDIFMISEKGENLLDNQKIPINENQLTLPFQFFPVNWRLLVSVPEDNSLQSGFKLQIVIYAVLFIIIISLIIVGVFLISRDINRESESMKLKTEFVHNVSHELKTPLSLIRLYGETLLLKENLPAKEKTDALKIITKESERLSHMINNILDFSKIEIGRKEFNIRKGYLGLTVKNTLESYQYHLEKKGFNIVEEIDESLPPIYFDKEGVEGIIVNLLSNSIKYSPEKKEVRIKLYKEQEYLVLTIADKGIGISEKDLPEIFQRFYRTKQKPDLEARGSGLGLTIVKHIIEAHQGKVEVESSPGSGSTFKLFFPVYENKNETG